jgi:hypothetical protein
MEFAVAHIVFWTIKINLHYIFMLALRPRFASPDDSNGAAHGAAHQHPAARAAAAAPLQLCSGVKILGCCCSGATTSVSTHQTCRQDPEKFEPAGMA